MAEWKMREATARDVWQPPGKVVKMYRFVASAEGYPDIVFELPSEKCTTAIIDATMKEKAREMEQLMSRKVRV